MLLRRPVASYYSLLLRSCLLLVVDAPYTPSSKLPPSPAVSRGLPMSTTRLSLLPNHHPKAVRARERMEECCGTLWYYAPELVEGRAYRPVVDEWAAQLLEREAA